MPVRIKAPRKFTNMVQLVSEYALQVSCVEWLSQYHAQGRLWFTHIANGEKRSPRTAAKLKKLGVMPGAPDLIVIIGERDCPGIRAPKNKAKVLFIELKSTKGRMSEAQARFCNWCIKNDVPYWIVHSLEQLQQIIEPMLGVHTRRAA